MSEYWKSTPKYWCKHCSAYVKDTPFERKQHESTAKHQNNLKRFLRDIQNNHERGERDKERAKLEVERLSRLAGGHPTSSFDAAVPSAPATASAGRNSASGPLTVADQKRQWTQLADMGISVPEQFRSEMAMAGDWKQLSSKVVDDPSAEAPLSIGVKKRKNRGEDGEEEEEQEAGETVARRGWGATTKQYPGHHNADLDDLLSGTISLKREKPVSPDSAQVKDEEKEPVDQEGNLGLEHEASDSSNIASIKPEGSDAGVQTNTDLRVKKETEVGQGSTSMDNIPDKVSMPVFKKRKAKAS